LVPEQSARPVIGACAFDPAPQTVPDWLAAIERPIVLVSTSSEQQGDVDVALLALTAGPRTGPRRGDIPGRDHHTGEKAPAGSPPGTPPPAEQHTEPT
jgi:hypothetical protein